MILSNDLYIQSTFCKDFYVKFKMWWIELLKIFLKTIEKNEYFQFNWFTIV